MTECKDCEEGKFQPAEHQAGCIECHKGRYQDNTASTSCTACEEGRYQDVRGKTQCTKCSKGRFGAPDQTAQKASSYCTACAHGQYNPSLGQTSEICASPARRASTAITAHRARPSTARRAQRALTPLDGATHQQFVSHCSEPDAGTLGTSATTTAQSVAACRQVPCPRVDGLRYWWSRAGATQCAKKPLDCKRDAWGGLVLKVCYPFSDEVTHTHGTAGHRFRTVTKVMQVDAEGKCGLENQAECSRLGVVARLVKTRAPTTSASAGSARRRGSLPRATHQRPQRAGYWRRLCPRRWCNGSGVVGAPQVDAARALQRRGQRQEGDRR